MQFYKKITFSFILLLIFQTNLSAGAPYYIDFKYILNQSEAGKKAQTSLKNKLSSGIKNLKDKEARIKDEEKKIIKQKKVLSPEDYKKKVNELRNKISGLQKERNLLLDTVAKQRAKARNELLKNLNPLLSNYMKEKNIKMVIDKKNLILANKSLDITKDILALLNQKIKTIKLN